MHLLNGDSALQWPHLHTLPVSWCLRAADWMSQCPRRLACIFMRIAVYCALWLHIRVCGIIMHYYAWCALPRMLVSNTNFHLMFDVCLSETSDIRVFWFGYFASCPHLHSMYYSVCCMSWMRQAAVVYCKRIKWLVTFSSSIHDNCDDNENHYHSYAQHNDASIVFCLTNGHFICEKSEEGSVLKCATKHIVSHM